jgi:hypothetical protein
MFPKTTAKTPSWLGRKPKGINTSCRRKASQMTTPYPGLESLGFEEAFQPQKVNTKETKFDDATRVRERAVEAPEHMQTMAQAQRTSAVEKSASTVDVAGSEELTGMAKSTSLHPGRTEEI